MLGVLVNCAAIIVFSFAGSFGLRRIPARFEQILKKALGLSTMYVGLKGAFDNERVLLLIMSMVAGALIGEFIDIDALFNKAGAWAERRLSQRRGRAVSEYTDAVPKAGGAFSKSFVQASILFCTGSMAIVGSMQSGLQGSHETLFAKSILDGSFSLVFSASAGAAGIGVAFSAVPVFLYQGGIVLLAGLLRSVLTPEIITEMSAVGSLLIAAIGFNFLGVQEIKVANLIPAVFIPAIYLSVIPLFGA